MTHTPEGRHLESGSAWGFCLLRGTSLSSLVCNPTKALDSTSATFLSHDFWSRSFGNSTLNYSIFPGSCIALRATGGSLSYTRVCNTPVRHHFQHGGQAAQQRTELCPTAPGTQSHPSHTPQGQNADPRHAPMNMHKHLVAPPWKINMRSHISRR